MLEMQGFLRSWGGVESSALFAGDTMLFRGRYRVLLREIEVFSTR